MSTTSATPVPFAFVFDPWGRLVVTEALNSFLVEAAGGADPAGRHLGVGGGADRGQAVVRVDGVGAHVSNAGSGTLSSFKLDSSGVPVLVNATAATVQAGVTDSAVTGDQRFLYVECGGAGTLDAFRVHHDGTLTLVQTVTGLPMPPDAVEGIALN